MRSISKPTFAFLADLAQNNDREWFGAHKKQYQAAKEEFLTFVDEVIAGISAFDPSIVQLTAKDCIFRINRDVRFSADKSPYQTYFGAHILGAAARTNTAVPATTSGFSPEIACLPAALTCRLRPG